MDLQTRLMEDMKTAMKSGDKARTSVIRMLRTDLKNAQIAKGRALDESEALDLLSRYARKRVEAAEEYRAGGREDLVAKELSEAEIVKEYLPAALSEEDLAALVDAVIGELGAEGLKMMGRVMKEVLARASGRAEGSAVSALVKARLS